MILSNYWKAIPQFAPMNSHHADKFIESVQYERSAFVQGKFVWDKVGVTSACIERATGKSIEFAAQLIVYLSRHYYGT